jgi:hypothetical protein
MINARINANGNDRKDFVQAYMALTAVDEAIKNAMSVLATNVLHGRNYPQADSVDEGILTATYDREAVLAKLTAATDATRDIQHALMGVINGED